MSAFGDESQEVGWVLKKWVSFKIWEGDRVMLLVRQLDGEGPLRYLLHGCLESPWIKNLGLRIITSGQGIWFHGSEL